MGSRRIIEVWSAESSPAAAPSRTRAAPAKNEALSIVPGTSNPVLSLIGLTVWAVSVRASSSARRSSSAARECSSCDRSMGHSGYIGRWLRVLGGGHADLLPTTFIAGFV
jgi:hypothetical protein